MYMRGNGRIKLILEPCIHFYGWPFLWANERRGQWGETGWVAYIVLVAFSEWHFRSERANVWIFIELCGRVSGACKVYADLYSRLTWLVLWPDLCRRVQYAIRISSYGSRMLLIHALFFWSYNATCGPKVIPTGNNDVSFAFNAHLCGSGSTSTKYCCIKFRIQ